LYEIVGSDFTAATMDPDYDVLILVYAKWNDLSRQLLPVFKELAMNVTNVKGLRIAKIDTMTNDAEGLNSKYLPGLKFYPRGKDKKVMEYDGGPDFENFSTWLSEYSEAFKKARPEEVEERQKQKAKMKEELKKEQEEAEEKAK